MSSHTAHTIKNGLKMLTGQLGINIFSIFFGIYFAHVLALKEMAILAVLLLIGGIFPVFSSFGMLDTLGRKIPGFIERGEKKRANKYFITVLYIQTLTALLFIALSLNFLERISLLLYKSVMPFETVGIIICYAFMQNLMLLMNTMLRALQHFGRLSVVKVSEQISARILSLVLFFVFGVNGVLLGMLLGSIIGFFMYCYYLKSHFRFIKPSFRFIKGLMQYSFPYYIAAWLRFSVMHADKYFVGIFFQPELLAVYYVSHKIIDFVFTVMDSMANSITAKLAQLRVHGQERMESIFSKVFKYYSLIYIPFIGLMIAFARPIVELYGGIKYSNSFPILLILASGLMLAPFAGLLETFVYILGKPAERLKIRLFSGIFNVIGSYILMKLFGVNGIALSKLFVWVIYTLAGALILKKLLRISIDKDILLKVTKLFLPIILVGVFIQVFFYEIYLISIYFIVFILILVLFYVKIIKEDPGLSEFLPKYFKRR